jgi:hypothetical protein
MFKACWQDKMGRIHTVENNFPDGEFGDSYSIAVDDFELAVQYFDYSVYIPPTPPRSKCAFVLSDNLLVSGRWCELDRMLTLEDFKIISIETNSL